MVFITWILHSLFWIPGHLCIRIFYGYRVVGKEHLAELKDIPHGVLFYANHRSQVDPFFITGITPFFSRLRPMFFVSLPAAEYTHLPLGRYLYGGILFFLFGAYPAYRGLGDYNKVLRHHLKLLRKGRSVCIFPEGGITKTGTIEKARNGVAFLAQETGATCVPLLLSGTRRVTVHIGKPFVSRGESPEEMMNHIRALQTHGA